MLRRKKTKRAKRKKTNSDKLPGTINKYGIHCLELDCDGYDGLSAGSGPEGVRAEEGITAAEGGGTNSHLQFAIRKPTKSPEYVYLPNVCHWHP